MKQINYDRSLTLLVSTTMLSQIQETANRLKRSYSEFVRDAIADKILSEKKTKLTI
jgi:hypothetical protein